MIIIIILISSYKDFAEETGNQIITCVFFLFTISSTNAQSPTKTYTGGGRRPMKAYHEPLRVITCVSITRRLIKLVVVCGLSAYVRPPNRRKRKTDFVNFTRALDAHQRPGDQYDRVTITVLFAHGERRLSRSSLSPLVYYGLLFFCSQKVVCFI